MFSLPIDQLEFTHIEDFCRTGPREGIILDFKRDFPTRLDKSIAAFANTYGGHVLIGVDETPQGAPVLPIVGIPLDRGLRERVVSVALQGISPPVYPEVKVIEFKSDAGLPEADRALIVIRVHESDSTPHAVDGGTRVYLRVDNVTKPHSAATVGEIEWLIHKRQKSVDFKRVIIDRAQTRAANHLIRLRNSLALPTTWPAGRVVILSVPCFPREELASPHSLLTVYPPIRLAAPINFPLPNTNPEPVADGVRFSEDHRPRFEYTEVNRFGLIYSEVGFIWEEDAAFENAVHCYAIAQLLAASLEYSRRLYERVGYFGVVEYQMRMEPVLNRQIVTLRRIGGGYYPEPLEQYSCLENVVKMETSLTVSELGGEVLATAKSLYRDFLWAFGWSASDDIINGHFEGINFA